MSREDVYPKEKSDGRGRTGHVFIGVGIGKVVNLGRVTQNQLRKGCTGEGMAAVSGF